ncbi:MAG: hypothetical protein ABGX26_02920 [Nautiliaceae bacterium]
MIKQIKLNNLIHTNIEPYYIDEEGNKVWNISNNLEELRTFAIDTIRCDAGRQLKKTDWVVTKIAEIQITGGDVEAAKEKYADILQEREAIRAKSNELEAKINEAKDFDELLEIVKDLRV